MMRRTRRTMGICVTLLILNVAFIWGNSLLPGEASAALSQWVKDLLRLLFPNSLPSSGGSGLLRKLAHFCEFCSLGMLLRWLVAMLCRKQLTAACLPLVCGTAVACIDETIQCFVPDRGPSLRDVGIDTAGVALGILLLTAGYIVYQKMNHKKLEETTQ